MADFDPASEPLGTADPRVRDLNTRNLDRGVNSSAMTWVNRFGEEQATLRAGSIASQEVVDTAAQAKQNIEEQVEGLRDEVDTRLNGILIAGGRIFDDEAQGRAAAGDGQYFYAASPDNNVSRTLYERISESQSRFVADDPSALFVSRTLVASTTGPKMWSYPHSDFHLFGFEKVTVDQNLNLISFTNDGRFISLVKGQMRGSSYPFTSYSEYLNERAVIDINGSVVSDLSMRQAFGTPCRYPFTDFANLWPYVVVDASDSIIEIKDVNGNQEESASELGLMFIEVDASTNVVKAAWLHGENKMLRVTYQPNGKNSLFNWRQTEIASGQDLEKANWTTIQSSNSDCWPPYIVEALNNGDGASQIYTGGNHGSDGGAGGSTTAKMDSCKIFIDGKRILPGASVNGFADRLRIEWVNQVMAYNTISFSRYVIEQRLMMEITPGSASGFCEVVALEPIAIKTDNGPQIFSAGYDTIHFYDGQAKSRITIEEADGLSSGPFAAYPTWAAVLGSDEYGFHGAWMDRDYGAGDGRYLSGSIGYWRRGGGSNTKVYAAVVGTGAVSFEAGDTYEWHGGYFWAPYEYALGADSAFIFRKRNKPTLGWATLDAQAGKIQIPQIERGSEIAGLGVAGFSGVDFQTNGYLTSQNTVEL